ncbi:MAG: helix-turn-helix domain-containing protein [Candidatus Buchananbacteria bacterium]
MNTVKIFEKIGLNKKETAIYLATLELGVSTASQITKKTGLHRTYFYDLVKELIQNGFIKQSKSGSKTYFVAESPDKILMMEEQKIAELKKAIPELNAINNQKEEKPKVYYYEGIKGIDEINNETLRIKDSELVAFTTPRFVTTKEQTVSDDYIKRRKVAGKKVRVIGEMSNEILELKKRDKNELRETRILPRDIFHSEIEIGVGGDKVYIVNYKDEFGMIIEDKEIARVQKQIFEIVWNSGKIIKT